jgi:hypothetical protein
MQFLTSLSPPCVPSPPHATTVVLMRWWLNHGHTSTGTPNATAFLTEFHPQRFY